MNPLDYCKDALNSDPSLQAVEIEASLTMSQDMRWSFTWDARTFQDDEHSDYVANASLGDLNDSITIYLESLAKTFIINTKKKVYIRFERANPQQDIWRCEHSIKKEGVLSALWRWLKEFFL